MKISEIIFDDKKELFDKIINEDITTNTKILFKTIEKQTNGFTELAHERYSPDDLDELYDTITEFNRIIIQYYSTVSQTYKIIEWLIYYFKP